MKLPPVFSGCDYYYRSEFNEFIVVCPTCGAKTRVPNVPGAYSCNGRVWDDEKGPIPCKRNYYIDYLKFLNLEEERKARNGR